MAVKVDQRIVQDQGQGFALGGYLLGQGQAQAEVELVAGSPAQGLGVALRLAGPGPGLDLRIALALGGEEVGAQPFVGPGRGQGEVAPRLLQ